MMPSAQSLAATSCHYAEVSSDSEEDARCCTPRGMGARGAPRYLTSL